MSVMVAVEAYLNNNLSVAQVQAQKIQSANQKEILLYIFKDLKISILNFQEDNQTQKNKKNNQKCK